MAILPSNSWPISHYLISSRYVPPPWMDVDTLEAIKEAEKGSQTFTKMPSDHYMLETKLIIGETPEDVPRSEEIRTMIKDIFDIRMSKYRAFMDTYVKGDSTQIKLDNLTPFEIHSCTPVFTHSLDLIGRLKQVTMNGICFFEIPADPGLLPFPSEIRYSCLQQPNQSIAIDSPTWINFSALQFLRQHQHHVQCGS